MMSNQGHGKGNPATTCNPSNSDPTQGTGKQDPRFSKHSQDSGERLTKPIHTERHMRIICIGAGASGLLFAYKLQRSFTNFTLTIYEKNTEVSGTWHENRYPGVACDVPAHNYTWSFEPNFKWSHVYASGPEIFQYFDGFKNKYELGKYVQLRHQVVGAQWVEMKGEWAIDVEDLSTGRLAHEQCDILINAAGILNNWKWPAIPGLEDFQGPLLHSASWDESINLAGQKVGLIGNGSTGIQILPAIQPIVNNLTTFIRSPTWIAPPFGVDQKSYTEQEKAAFAEKSSFLAELREVNETNSNSMLGIYFPDSELQRSTRNTFTEQMMAKLQNDENLKEHLIPHWGVGCRRLTPGIGYLEALRQSNVTVVFGEITSIAPSGPRTADGTTHAVDILICATGFDTSFKPRFPLFGHFNLNLQDTWASEAHSYLGLAAANMPNYMMFLGPNCPIGNGPVLIAIEAEADYMLALCDKWQTENIHSFTPKDEAVADFVKHTDAFMQGTVWQQDCRSWYKSNSATGRVSALWPGSTLHYIEALKQPRWEDWNITYHGNRFIWLGNGFSQTEVDPHANLGYYIRSEDDGTYSSRQKRRKMLTHRGVTYTKQKNNQKTAAGSILQASRL